MKKNKLFLIAIAIVLGACLLTGCKKNETESVSNKEKSVAIILSEQFKKEIAKESDIEKVAKNISKNEVLKISTNVETLKKTDYITGFKKEIKDFDKAVVIRPIIGTIPFLAYIFEVKDAKQFAKELKTNADLRWNFCTEADDLEVTVVDNYVFIVMSPKEFDE